MANVAETLKVAMVGAFGGEYEAALALAQECDDHGIDHMVSNRGEAGRSLMTLLVRRARHGAPGNAFERGAIALRELTGLAQVQS